MMKSTDRYCYPYIQIGELKKGLNPPSIMNLQFGSQHLTLALKTGIVTGVIALAVSSHHCLVYTWIYNFCLCFNVFLVGCFI